MSSAEGGDNNALVKQLETLVRKAYSVAQRALRALTAAANSVNQSNPNPYSPAATLSFTTTAYATKVSTTVDVTVYASGLCSAADDRITLSILQDGTPLSGVLQPITNAGTGTGHEWELTAKAFVTVAVGASHTYAVQVADGDAGTLSIAARQFQVFLSEIPS